MAQQLQEIIDLQNEAESQPVDHSPHKYAVSRAEQAKELAAAKGITVGQAIVKVMAKEKEQADAQREAEKGEQS